MFATFITFPNRKENNEIIYYNDNKASYNFIVTIVEGKKTKNTKNLAAKKAAKTGGISKMEQNAQRINEISKYAHLTSTCSEKEVNK